MEEQKKAEHAARQKEIRDKARRIFVQYGYRKTTIEDIGNACGLGKAALYHYFSSKEEIFEAVVRAESERMLTNIRAAVAAVDDPKAQLTAMIKTRFREVDAFVSELLENRCTAELRETLPQVADTYQSYLDEEVRILQKILEEGARRGVFKKISSPFVPMLMIAGLYGVAVHLMEVDYPPPMDEAIDALLALFLDGLCH